MLDLKELGRKLDEALAKETDESINDFIKSQRIKENMEDYEKLIEKFKLTPNNAKECALICIDEQINLLKKLDKRFPDNFFKNEQYILSKMKLDVFKSDNGAAAAEAGKGNI